MGLWSIMSVLVMPWMTYFLKRAKSGFDIRSNMLQPFFLKTSKAIEQW